MASRGFIGNIRAGQMRHLVGFFRRGTTDDGYGNTETAYPDEPEFTTSAMVAAKFGGEAILADRLQGRETYLVAVRQSDKTSQVTTDWMIKDMREGTILSVKSGPVDPDDCGAFYEFLCQSGGAP